MDKKQNFLMIVQTGAIVNDIRYERYIAMQVVATATDIPEEKIPDDVYSAAWEYIEFQYKLDPLPEPNWIKSADK